MVEPRREEARGGGLDWWGRQGTREEARRPKQVLMATMVLQLLTSIP